MREPDSQRAGQATGGPEALAALYEQYAARLFAYFQYRCGDSAAAQDLTMQVFERLLGCLPTYDPDQAPFAAWLFAIARHVAADWQRRQFLPGQYLRRFIPWENFTHRPSADPGPEQAALESEERQQLRRALARLSKRERDVIGLRFAGGLTNRAIAGLTGLSESNVAVILFRALGKLRQALASEAPSPDSFPLAEVDHE